MIYILVIILSFATGALLAISSTRYLKGDGLLLRWYKAKMAALNEFILGSCLDLSPHFHNIALTLAPISFPLIRIYNRRIVAIISKQLPDMLGLLQNAIKSGLALPQAIELASVELPQPIGREIAKIRGDLRLGVSIEDALALFAKRVPCDDVELMVLSIDTLRRTGGNLAITFHTIKETIEARIRVADKIHIATAQGVYQGIILLAMPWLLCFAISLLAPDYMQPLFSTRLGILFMIFGILLEVFGAMWLKHIVMVKV